MKESVYLFDIWNEEFTTKNKGKGIYKIFFKNFPNHCYIGKTTDIAGFSKRLAEHRTAIWKTFSGISIRDALTSYNLLSQTEYRKLLTIPKYKYDETLQKNMNQKIKNFEKDILKPGDSKYVKMIVFMRMNKLTLNDLRFEILFETNENKNLFDLEHKLINENECYEKGFNATAMSEYTFGGVGERKNMNSIIKMKKIIEEKKEDQFTQWNCWWNLYQTFKFSFLGNILGWTNFWKKISISELETNLTNLSQLIINKNINTIIPNINHISEDWKNAYLENYENLNSKILLANFKNTKVSKLINPKVWIQNDNDYYFNLHKIKDNIDQDFYNFYGSWEKIHSLFIKNPFNNTKSVDSFVKEYLTRFLQSYEILKNSAKGFQEYKRIKNNLELGFNSIENEGNIIYDFYFQENYLNSQFLNEF